jgi:peptide chain release factor 1
MYSRYAERSRFKTEILSINESDLGGIKEISFLVNGKGAYSRLKYESGVHRVQRIPETESGGRIHTSTVTVAVLPEAEEVDVELDLNDVRVDVFRSSGNGGQSVNTTDSAVRVTHTPTGIVVSCQDEKSQLKNKDKALKILRARLYDLELERQTKELAEERKSQVGRGNRNERIRTYNFPQGRLTDHRIGLTLYRLDAIVDGDLNEVMDALITTDQAEKLQAANQ